MPQKWYYKTMIPKPGFIYKISFLKKWENLHHYLTYFERTLFRILLFGCMDEEVNFDQVKRIVIVKNYIKQYILPLL